MPPHKYSRRTRETRVRLEKFLGELELAVMEIVWAHGPVTVRTVLDLLNQGERALAYTTVMTILSRLAEKGWVRTEKEGRAFLYQATRSPEEAEAAAVGEVVRALLHDFGEVAVAQFVKELDQVEASQLARLAELGREAEQEQDEES